MQLVFADTESFWSAEHRLTRMSPISYALSPLTEIQSVAVKIGDGPTDVTFGEDAIRKRVGEIDWADSMLVFHNANFDAMIWAWRLGVRPAMWGCTLAMARPKYAKTVGLSLAKLAAHFDIGRKDSTALVNTKGRYLADFTNAERAAMEIYNRDDTEMCAKLFHKLKPDFSAAELWHLDCNIRMLVEAEFELDKGLLQTALSVERSNKHKALLDVAKLLRPIAVPEPAFAYDDPPDDRVDELESFWGDEEKTAEWVRTQMASAPKFAALLENLGVEVPVKRSPTNPTVFIPALAKTDEAMTELLEHDDSRVAAAARARLSTKSTQLETRIQSFLDTYDAVGKLPVPVNYCGADTTGRDSGWLYNMLNLPRVSPDKPRVADALRNSVLAPDDKVIFVADLSGIELRVNHTLWRVARSMKMWREKPNADLYRDTAAHMYNIRLDEVAKPQRHYAKVLELACFAAGTRVITDSGAKPIERVTASDRVWDGVEWVSTEGAICRGEKETLEARGLCATLDHEILTERGWVAWSAVAETPNLFRSALCSANLPSSDGTGAALSELAGASGALCAAAPVAGLGSLHPRTCAWGAAQGATPAPKTRRLSRECVSEAWSSFRADLRGAAFYLVSHLPWLGATTHRTRGTVTTAPAESRCAMRGALTRLRSWSTSSRSTGGTAQNSTWTGSTTTVGTSPATSASCPAVTTPGTGELSSSWRNESPRSSPRTPVFDLLNCGPRSRFTVLTDDGPLVVHNCGFGIGGDKFRDTARVQGGLKLSKEAAHEGVKFWRGRYPEISDFDTGGWGICDRALNYIAEGVEREIDPWGLCHTEKDAIRLPSGRRIHYPNLRQELKPRHRVVDGKLQSKMELTWVYAAGRHEAYLYGGKVDENIVQALARDVLFPNALEFWKITRLRPKHKVYDELVYLAPPDRAPEWLALLQEIMRTPPSWWPELVLWSEGDIARSYGASKG